MANQLPEGIYKAGNGLLNFYLIEEGGKFTLVDAGLPGDWRILERWLKGNGRSATDVEAIICTHAHRDHIGGAHRAEQESGSDVRIHLADHPYAAARGGFAFGPGVPGEGRPPFGRGIPLMLARIARNIAASRILRYRPPQRLLTFRDGEVLDVPGRPLVVHAPGHTPGSVCFHLPEKGVLFSGDALVTYDVLRGRRGPRLLPPAVNFSNVDARESLGIIENLEASVVLPGHGEPYFGTPAEAVAKARAPLGD